MVSIPLSLGIIETNVQVETGKQEMIDVKRTIAGLLLVATVATSKSVMASETGRKNTRNALGAATIIMAVKGNTTGALVGAAGTVIAQKQLSKSIKKRHTQAKYTGSRRYTRSKKHTNRGYHGVRNHGRNRNTTPR